MNVKSATMNNGNTGIQVEGIFLFDVDIDGQLHETHQATVYVEDGVEYPDPQEATADFEQWITSHAYSAINTKDDRIAQRPNIWPDGTQHAGVYRAWHLDDDSISIWTSPAPKPPMVP